MESKAEAVWSGDLMTGKGTTTARTSGIFKEAALSWKSRAEAAGPGNTTPEELLAASHASCFAMAFSHGLAAGKTPAQKLEVQATVTFGPKAGGGGFEVKSSALEVKGWVKGIDQAAFATAAEAAKDGCPISLALKNNVAMSVKATLQA